jgi:hypothetical protein
MVGGMMSHAKKTLLKYPSEFIPEAVETSLFLKIFLKLTEW